jgi:hypothetical protein
MARKKQGDIAEENARLRALAAFYDWLKGRYAAHDLTEMSGEGDNLDPISLRKLYIPLRLSEEDIEDTAMAGPEEVVAKETPQNEPGRELTELLIDNPFLVISGRPGSGKTTLVKWIVSELTGHHPSRLRRPLQGQQGIAPLPIALRELGDLGEIQDLAQLLDRWWEVIRRQAGERLDYQRLSWLLTDPDGERFPVLLMMDGIDEVGGQDIRGRLLNMAGLAAEAGFRVVVTGRPAGLADLPISHLANSFRASESLGFSPSREAQTEGPLPPRGRDREGVRGGGNEPDFPPPSPLPPAPSQGEGEKGGFVRLRGECGAIHYLTPLSWPRIQQFIHDWYRLRPEWRHKAELGIPNFLDALQDPNREYLLTLARRPIFLTLMAQVHTADNEMPHGRAELYSRIIDLYLERQERHRQLRNFTDGSENPAWPPSETRLVLGHLAWLSQIKGSEGEEGEQADKRRVVWSRGKLLAEIQSLLSEGRERRFSRLTSEDAERLLSYFLHPAGLLVEPAEGEVQFAHLSFQEYLCAEYILSGLSPRRFERDIKERLFSRLDRPGWDEVALLLLTIQEKRTQNRGHFDILHLLDPTDCHQARLLVTAVNGSELRFPDDERLRWLPLAVLCALLHPEEVLGEIFSPAEYWVKSVKSVLERLFEAGQGNGPIDELETLQRELPPIGYLEEEAERVFEEAKEIWINGAMPRRDSLCVGDLLSSRFYALLLFLLSIDPENMWIRFLRGGIFRWIDTLQDASFWVRNKMSQGAIPCVSDTAKILQVFLGEDTHMYRVTLDKTPVDVWLLQGESVMKTGFFRYWNLPFIDKTFVSPLKLGRRTIVAIIFYQIQQIIGVMVGVCTSLALVCLRERAFARIISMSHGNTMSWVLPHTRALFAVGSLYDKSPESHRLIVREAAEILSSGRMLSQKLTARLCLAIENSSQAKLALGALGHRLKSEDSSERVKVSVEKFCYGFAAHDWFNEQAEDPDLMKRRGLRPGEPLPKEFNCFDESGRPLPIQRRENWMKLREWADDFDAILEFVFPEGLEADQRQLLLDDLEMLQRQSWAPQKALDAILASWPEEQPERDISMAYAEQKLIEACEAFLAE